MPDTPSDDQALPPALPWFERIGAAGFAAAGAAIGLAASLLLVSTTSTEAPAAPAHQVPARIVAQPSAPDASPIPAASEPKPATFPAVPPARLPIPAGRPVAVARAPVPAQPLQTSKVVEAAPPASAVTDVPAARAARPVPRVSRLPLELAGRRLRIFLDGRREGEYAFFDDGRIEFTKLDGSVEYRLRYEQDGSRLTLYTATGSLCRGTVSDRGFSVRIPYYNRALVLTGSP